MAIQCFAYCAEAAAAAACLLEAHIHRFALRVMLWQRLQKLPYMVADQSWISRACHTAADVEHDAVDYKAL